MNKQKARAIFWIAGAFCLAVTQFFLIKAFPPHTLSAFLWIKSLDLTALGAFVLGVYKFFSERKSPPGPPLSGGEFNAPSALKGNVSPPDKGGAGGDLSNAPDKGGPGGDWQLSIIIFLILCAALELTCWALQPKAQPKIIGDYYEKGIRPDSILGYAALPIQQFKIKKLNENNRLVYDASYTFNQYAHRIANNGTAKTKQQFLAFFGCSCTFGEGCSDRETLPYLLDSLNPDYQTYNFGFHGYAPQHAQAQLTYGLMDNEIRQDSGIGIYVLLDHHVPRVEPNYLTIQWLWRSPVFDSTNHVGAYWQIHPWRTYFLGLLGKSYTLKRFNIARLQQPSDKAEVETVNRLEICQKLFQKRFPQGKFYVLLYPTAVSQALGYPYPHAKPLKRLLSDTGIPTLDYSELWSFNPADSNFVGAYAITDDGHPNANGHRVLAEKLNNWLNHKEIKKR